jgi:hypothetical protein
MKRVYWVLTFWNNSYKACRNELYPIGINVKMFKAKVWSSVGYVCKTPDPKSIIFKRPCVVSQRKQNCRGTNTIFNALKSVTYCVHFINGRDTRFAYTSHTFPLIYIKYCGDPRKCTQPPATSTWQDLLKAATSNAPAPAQQVASLLARGWIRLRLTLDLCTRNFAA